MPVTSGRAGLITALFAMLSVSVGVHPAAWAEAETAESVSLQARASAAGVRVGFGVPDFVVVEQFVDGGGPVTEAVIDSLGNSRSFASLPHPGDLFIGGPPTVAGLLGLPSPPAYPFHVSSSYPSNPDGAFGQDGWRLRAHSDAVSSAARAESGRSGAEAAFLAAWAEATTTRDAASGAVTSSASAVVEGFRIGDVLSIGRLASNAAVRRSEVETIERQSAFRVEGLLIAGQAVGVTEGGLALGDQATPLPPSDPLLQALAGQGITLAYVAPRQDPDGITSAGLAITQEFTLPSGQTLRATYLFGQSRAEAVSQSFDDGDNVARA